MTGFEADAERLASGAKDFDGLVRRAAQISADLDGALDGAAAAWGADEVGRSFAAAHATPAEDSAKRLRELADGLGDVGGSFADAARRYRAGDAAAQRSIADAAGE
ncbi:PE domain-containing protein [Amycolatopsis sp. K13G38]|uniref:PE domain-containing protein n=1 Tax=Amycolatopsis acididurans TaxID=2724524 RepID=A0ABX1JIA0_9PSEU|nr:PE domain-containing protein [Amycolatopsis acididurans]NKQ59333.1 PE domain-containing protein [Amycolatopsis acididurans]